MDEKEKEGIGGMKRRVCFVLFHEKERRSSIRDLLFFISYYEECYSVSSTESKLKEMREKRERKKCLHEKNDHFPTSSFLIQHVMKI